MKLKMFLLFFLIGLFGVIVSRADRYNDSDYETTLSAIRSASSYEEEREKEDRKKAIFKYGTIALAGAAYFGLKNKMRP